MMTPTLAGFTSFVRNTMGVNATALPDDSEWLTWAFDYAREVTNRAIGLASSLIYTLAVYNLGADFLANYAPDGAGQCVFAEMRKTYKLGAFAPGVVQSTSDNGSSTSLLVPDFLKEMTFADLQELKTPWGRAYLGFAQKYGTLWGMS